MDLSKLDVLLGKIATGKDFSEVMGYFFDHFGEDPEFIDTGEPAQDELLTQLLAQIGGAIFKTDKVRLDNLRLIRIPEHRFIHGGMTINGAPANVIYREDLRQGIVMVYRPTAMPPTIFTRFSAEMLAPGHPAKAAKYKH